MVLQRHVSQFRESSLFRGSTAVMSILKISRYSLLLDVLLLNRLDPDLPSYAVSDNQWVMEELRS